MHEETCCLLFMTLIECLFILFLPIACLYKGGLLFSWTNYARWLQRLHLGQTRDPCELGCWEEPTSKHSLTVPALAQYSATGTIRVQHKRSAFSNWPRTASSLRRTSRQHGILWQDHPDCHSEPKFQQKMSRVQSLQRCDSVQPLMQRQEAERNRPGLKAEPRWTDRTYRLGRRIRFPRKINFNPRLHRWIIQNML